MSKPWSEEVQRSKQKRYQALVDKSFQGGLTPVEEGEMEMLAVEIDSFYDDFYQPIIERLEARLKTIRSKEPNQ